jgi:Domain of unknown function (DUF6089)
MLKKMIQKTLLLAFLLCLMLEVSGQTWEVGGFVGGAGYMGDINPTNPAKINNMAFGVQLKRNFDGYWSAKLNIMHGKIQDDDAKSSNEYQRQRNLNFYSALNEATVQVEFNFLNYLAGDTHSFKTKLITPYLFTGIGGILFDPKTMYNGQEYKLRLYTTEGYGPSYKNFVLTIPYGAGIKYNIAGNWSIVGEAGYRMAFTDHLDDISKNYPGFSNFDPADLVVDERKILSNRSNNPAIGAPGTQRGDYRKRDTYMFAGISLTYTFVSRKCPN